MKDDDDRRQYEDEWDEYKDEMEDEIEAELNAWAKNEFDILLIMITFAVLLLIQPKPPEQWRAFLAPFAPLLYLMGFPIYLF